MGFFDFLFNKKYNKVTQWRNVDSPKGVNPMSANSNNAYLLLFSASWCGPSKRFIKEIESGGINNYSLIDVDNNNELAEHYGIRGVPTSILVAEDGSIIKKWIGYDEEDSGQTQFIKYVKGSGYNILIHPKAALKSASNKNSNSFPLMDHKEPFKAAPTANSDKKDSASTNNEMLHLDILRQAVACMGTPSIFRNSTIPAKKFIFTSNQNQRYENNIPVGDIQNCVRTITVALNTEGCDGYLLTPGDGFIIKLFNDDIGRPQMADKPMRVYSKTGSKVELRGYEIMARTPFGYQEIDLGDYGFVIFYEKGVISRCQIHMFDRNTYIEYKILSTEVV